MTPTKEILKNQLTRLCTHSLNKEEQFHKDLSIRGIELMKLVGIEAKKIYIEPQRICVYVPELSSWEIFKVYRDRDWYKDQIIYKEPKIEWRSGDTDKETELKYIISIAKIAEHFLNKTDWWFKLVNLMNESQSFYDENKPIQTQCHELKEAIKAIENQELMDSFISVFNKGKIKLTKDISFDNIYSDEWEWKQNGKGTTYTLYFYRNVRINRHYDDNGNELEGEFEIRKYEVPKRVRKVDLESFIKHNIKNQVED